MNFASDNTAGAAPEILRALVAAMDGTAMPYGADPWTERMTARMAEIFEKDVAVFAVASGTASNALALAALTPPWGSSIYCHEDAHIQGSECGAPEFFSGAKLALLPGDGGKIAPATLEAALAKAGFGNPQEVQPAAVSLSQTTESGLVYRPEEIATLAAVARARGLRVHMDGARFANAVAALGCAPADLTWRAGVDVLSLGATKNGALAAEAVVFFDAVLAEGFAYRRKQAGQVFSKMRVVSSQFDAWLEGGLWLRLARHANAMAARLSAGLSALPGARLRWPTESNQVFVELPEAAIAGLEQAGYLFYRWEGSLLRFVATFETKPADVDALIETAARLTRDAA